MLWYNNGLKFTCKNCGYCCRIKEGVVWLYRDDIPRLTEKLDMSRGEFLSRYAERLNNRWILKSFPNGDCIFYEPEKGCRIYDARPVQCRTFPFWPDVVFSEWNWNVIAKNCPGMNTGEIHTIEEIKESVEAMKKAKDEYKRSKNNNR